MSLVLGGYRQVILCMPLVKDYITESITQVNANANQEA
jgi:hypothetical protein